MRVIAGRLKGRRLDGPRWEGLRPTSDALRETLFNILGTRVAGARVLDGHAGTGALGIEAISRGAAHVTFVDHDRRALALVARNLARCGVTGGYAIVAASVTSVVGRAVAPAFDLILLDPPYAREAPDDLLASAGEVVSPGGLVVLEHAWRDTAPARAGRLVRTRQVRAGDSALAFFEIAAP